MWKLKGTVLSFKLLIESIYCLGYDRDSKFYWRRVSNPMGQEANKIIYSMIQVSKNYDKKPVLKDISISFFMVQK